MNQIIATIGFFVGSLFTFNNIVRVRSKIDVPVANFIWMAAGWTAFIWGIWLYSI